MATKKLAKVKYSVDIFGLTKRGQFVMRTWASEEGPVCQPSLFKTETAARRAAWKPERVRRVRVTIETLE